MGLPRNSEDEHPPEPFTEGCPGAWYRSPFLQSLIRYMRQENRSNPLLDRCDDPLVHAAIVEYERQCAHARELVQV